MQMTVRKSFLVGLAASAALLVMTGAGSADGLAGAPTPFDKGGVKIALVSYLSGGDFFQAYDGGVTRQAQALGVDLHVFQGRQRPDEEREQIRQAIDLGVQGVIVNGGKAEAVSDVVQEALDKGIKVVAGNIYLKNPGIVLLDQDFVGQLNLVLDQVQKDNGDKFKAGYVYVEGFPALDFRDKAWKAFKQSHPGVEQVAQWGSVDDTTAKTVADQTAAVFRAHPEISVVIAPYDEFARGVKLALDDAGLSDKVKIYGVDVSTSDIQEIREPKSAWVATSAASAEGIGEVAARTLALAIAGQLKQDKIYAKATLITQQFLNDNNIKSERDLVAKLPAFLGRDISSASWIPSPAK
jgi:simple sugar transport system substrate-binding protein